jgi:serine/threonine protein kinase
VPGTHPDTDLPTFVGGRYRLEEPLGSGGAGEVWAATDTVLGRRVAVKLLRDHLRGDRATAERFRREATVAAGLAHPNVVTIYDIGADDDHPYLVMELVDGPSLADVLASGPVAPATAAAIGHAVAAALGSAHQQGLVHRDIKPANVLIASTGVVKVADFGVAKALGGAAQTLTADGHVMGTAAYLAPEQVTGESVGPEVDVYALGMVLWELLTGRSPFGTGTLTELLARRLSTEVPALPDEIGVSDELASVIRTATARSTVERFPDGGSLTAALTPLVPTDAEGHLARVANERVGQGSSPATARLEATAAHDALGTTRMLAQPDDADATRVLPAEPASDDRTGPVRPARSATPTPPAPRPAADRPAAAPPVEDEVDDGVSDGDTLDRGTRTALIAAAVLVALLIGALTLTRGGGGGGEDAAPEPQPTADAPLAIAGGGDHDPFGDSEHPEDVPAAFDGDPATAWTTQQYDSAALGGLKSGVGMWVDLGEPGTVSRVELDLGVPGATLELYAMDEQPAGDTEAWGPVLGTVGEAPSATVVELDEPVEARYWLVWFTSLPRDGGDHRTTIQELRLFPG